jgi:hypothetical protein
MANGDIQHADVEGFIVLGRPLPTTSNTGMTEAEADGICDEINAEVNLVLKRLGFGLPLGVAENILWAKGTKLFGASSLILDGMLAQDVEEGNTRAGRYWDRYLARINQLIDSNGDILDPDDISTDDPIASTSPRLVGDTSSEGQKRFLRFPQRAAADQSTDEQAIRDSGASWRSAIAGH